ncbi:MAG: AI-2E family transporter [Micrococcus sp.]|nr:AI-2E family transporter [Micrococcus sp.]
MVAPLLTDALGRAAIRGAQLLVLVVVAWLVVRALLAVEVALLAVLVALILASAVRPPVAWLERHGWSNTLAAATVFASLLLLLGGVITGVVLGIRGGWQDLAGTATSGWQQLQDLVHGGPVPIPVDADTVNAALAQAGDYFLGASGWSNAVTGLSVASEVITGTVLMVIVLFFFLKDGSRLWSFVLRWFRGETRAKLAESGDRAVGILGGYVRGVALIATIDAVFIGLGLYVVGVPLVIPLTVVVFVTAFVPIVGALIAGALAALVALVSKGLVAALIVIGIVFVVNHLEGYFLQPVVMGRTLSLHGLVILLALTAGSILGGVAGAVLAVPLTAVAWGVLPVWTDRYQSGQDPVLGPDPVHTGTTLADRVSRAQRWKYQLIRRQFRSRRSTPVPPGTPTPPGD